MPCAEPPQLAQGYVERFLGLLGAAAGIAEDAGTVAQGVVTGGNAVAQPSPLADFREEPRAHAAAQGPHGAPGHEIVVVAIGHAGVGDADVRLGRIVRHVQVSALGRKLVDRRFAGRLPIAQQAAHEVHQRCPLDAAGHAQDRALRLELPREKSADLVKADRLQGLLFAQRRAAPGVGEMAAAKLDHDLLRGLVFHRPQAQEPRSAGRRPTPRPAGADAAGRWRKWPVPRAGSPPTWPRHRRPARWRPRHGARRPGYPGRERTAGCRAAPPRGASSRRSAWPVPAGQPAH